jgi:hypothetical protein
MVCAEGWPLVAGHPWSVEVASGQERPPTTNYQPHAASLHTPLLLVPFPCDIITDPRPPPLEPWSPSGSRALIMPDSLSPTPACHRCRCTASAFLDVIERFVSVAF